MSKNKSNSLLDDELKTVDLSEAVLILGNDVTIENIHGRIRRGSLKAVKNGQGEWRVSIAELKQVLNHIDPCGSCSKPAVRFVIVKYHHHVRMEFGLCDKCAVQTEDAYSRKGGVLEVVNFPLLGEGWKKP